MPCRTKMRLLGHVDYPHSPGELYDCWACERECHCDGFECASLDDTCVHCVIYAESFS